MTFEFISPNDGRGPLFTAREEHLKLSITNLLNLVSHFKLQPPRVCYWLQSVRGGANKEIKKLPPVKRCLLFHFIHSSCHKESDYGHHECTSRCSRSGWWWWLVSWSSGWMGLWMLFRERHKLGLHAKYVQSFPFLSFSSTLFTPKDHHRLTTDIPCSGEHTNMAE